MGGKTSAAAKNRYNAKAYDRITLLVPKGSKEQIAEAARAKGQSVNSYIHQSDSSGHTGAFLHTFP